MNLLLWLSLLLGVQEPADAVVEGGDAQNALSIYRHQLEQHPDDRAAAWQVGYILYCQGELVEARSVFEDSLDRHGEQAYSVYMLAAIAELEFRYAAARELYSKSLEIDPEYSPARAGLDRLEGLLVDLVRFRAARQRLSRELVLVLCAAALLLGLGAYLTGLGRDRKTGPRSE